MNNLYFLTSEGMQVELNEIWDGTIPANEKDLVQLSDKIWGIGSLDVIKNTVSQEVFHLHIAMNLIGNWQCDGWHGIIAEHPDFVPYISETLRSIGLQNLQCTFNEIIAIFPDLITFKDDDLYFDIINFLENIRFKVQDERLNAYTNEERQAMVKQYHQKLDQLEEMTEPLWGYGSPMGGWAVIFEYIQIANINFK